MEGNSLIGLGEGVMIGLAGFVTTEPPNVGLHASLLLYLHCHNLDLVISKTNFHLEHIRHHKLISLYRVEIVLLLLTTIWLHHLSGYVNLVVLLLLPI